MGDIFVSLNCLTGAARLASEEHKLTLAEQLSSLLEAITNLVEFYDWSPALGMTNLTRHDIVVAESVLGVHLPEAYTNLLLQHNGGFLKTDYFAGIQGYSEMYNWRVFTISGLGGEEGLDSLRGNESLNSYLIDNWGYPDRSIIFCHQGHGGFALDYTAWEPGSEPPVIYVDADRFPHDIRIYKIAPDFASLLAGLTECN